MATIDEKIQATKFVLHTQKSFDQIRALGLEAAASASGTLTKIVESQVDNGESILYNVKRGGFLNVLTFGLVFSPTANESLNTVLLVPGHYLTSQATFLFIPIGPKDSVGYPPLRKFSEHIQAALSRQVN